MLGAECIASPCFDAGNRGSLPSGRDWGNGSSLAGGMNGRSGASSVKKGSCAAIDAYRSGLGADVSVLVQSPQSLSTTPLSRAEQH